MTRYVFTEDWQISAAPEAVAAIVTDLERYPEWWPQIRAVASLGPDDALVLCRSVLPYTLELVLHAETREPPTLEVSIHGDLEGFARWTLDPVPTGTRMRFTQEVTTTGLLAAATVVARPLLRWNHSRMMRGARRGLARHAR